MANKLATKEFGGLEGPCSNLSTQTGSREKYLEFFQSYKLKRNSNYSSISRHLKMPWSAYMVMSQITASVLSC